jgi:hypothetical protein
MSRHSLSVLPPRNGCRNATFEPSRVASQSLDNLTHCGIEWAYFNGHYWLAKPKVDTPSDWEGVEAGTMVLERRDVAAFEATKGGTVRFVSAAASYHPPNCE